MLDRQLKKGERWKAYLALEKVLARLQTSPGNQLSVQLALLAYSTRSVKFIDAFNELIEFGLDGPDWKDRLIPLFQRKEMEDEVRDLLFYRELYKARDAVSSFARGESQHGVARLIATAFPTSNSYDAAVQRARMWLRTSDSDAHRLLRLLNELPAGERRKGLEYARANRMIAEGQEISFEQGLAVIRDVLKVHHKVNDKGLAKLVREEHARPKRTGSRTTRFGSG